MLTLSSRESQKIYQILFWFKDNAIEIPLVEYRMRVHVFGISTSPSAVNYLRKAVGNHFLKKNITEKDYNSDASCLQRNLGINWDVIVDISAISR